MISVLSCFLTFVLVILQGISNRNYPMKEFKPKIRNTNLEYKYTLHIVEAC